MGSPYFVHRQSNRVHVVKTLQGFSRIISIVKTSMNISCSDEPIYYVDHYSPEWRVLRDLLLAYREAFFNNSRQVVFLESRYEWQGWEKFQRVIIIDNSRSTLVALPDELIFIFELDDSI